MRTIVSKFGGSSTANAHCFRQIKSILDQSPARHCVVLSAPGADGAHREKVTSLLERCWQLRNEPKMLASDIDAAAERYEEIARELSIFDVKALCKSEITNALYVSREHTLSRGEFLCAKLFGEWSGYPVLDAAKLIAFDAIGQLDEERTFSQIDVEARRQQPPFVLPGFYGADAAGHVRTFPRNGSDITGALAAAGMKAGLYENWTDVPGLMTADPTIVPSARLVQQVSYRQMRQLCRAGAQILHPACLDPVAMAGIPTRLRCTEAPESFGTLIDDHCDTIVPCIAGARETTLPEDIEDGRQAARISLFGVRLSDALPVARSLSPIVTRIRADQIDIYVERPDYEAAMRTLHRRLLE